MPEPDTFWLADSNRSLSWRVPVRLLCRECAKVGLRYGCPFRPSKGRKCQVMLSEPKLSEVSALIEVDEIPNHQANKPFSPSLPRNTANGKTYLNERKGSC